MGKVSSKSIAYSASFQHSIFLINFSKFSEKKIKKIDKNFDKNFESKFRVIVEIFIANRFEFNSGRKKHKIGSNRKPL